MERRIAKSLLHRISAVLVALLASVSSWAAADDPIVVDLDTDGRWTVAFAGRVYDAEFGETTFFYRVTVNDDPALSHFNLEIPLCGPPLVIVDKDPREGVTFGLDPVTGINGIKWDLPLATGAAREYFITVAGDNPGGLVDVAVKAGQFVALGQITGPVCLGGGGGDEETLSLAGAVFIDANGNAALDPDEPPAPNVTVVLLDGDGNEATALTDANGEYAFADLAPGDYVVSVPEVTDADDFNELLAAHFIPTTPAPILVTLVDADSTGNDFGSAMNLGSLAGFEGAGKGLGWWKHQLEVAIAGRGRAHVSAADLAAYIGEIEALFLVNPFQFEGDEFVAAFDVLSIASSEAVDILGKHLLTLEFNHVAGGGLTGDLAALQAILVAWGEYLMAHPEFFTRDQLLEAKDLFESINEG